MKIDKNQKVMLTFNQLKSLVTENIDDDDTETKIDELTSMLKNFVKEYGFRGLARNMTNCFGFQDSRDCVEKPL